MIKTILFIVAWFILVTAAYAGISAAPWVPTKPTQKKKLIDRLNFKEEEKVYDLGCGTGTLLFACVKSNPHIHAVGFEISALPYFIGKIRSLWTPNVSIKFKNLFGQDLSEVDTIFVFLLTKSYPRLIKKFRELKPDAQIIIEAWPLPNFKPVQTIKEEGLLPVFIYKGSQFQIF